MRRVLAAVLLVLPVLLAGCTSPPADDDSPPHRSGFVFRTSRVDTSGDGLVDAVNVTLVSSREPVEVARLGFEVDGEPHQPEALANATEWVPGSSVLIPCSEGVHELRILYDGETRKVVVGECGVPPPTQPPFFEGRLIDGDADGRQDAVRLSLVSGGPIRVGDLNVSMGDETLRVYQNPLKSRLAGGSMGNGTEVYTPCVPGERRLEITWRSTELPPLTLRGCDVHRPGVDAPVRSSALDVDSDGHQDGWNLTLANASDAPFAIADVFATWGNQTATVNGSPALDPAPPRWDQGVRLYAVCPSDGEQRFTLYVRDHTVFRNFTSCEEAPGAPLLDLNLTERHGSLNATLAFSRVGDLAMENLTRPDGDAVGDGVWPVGAARTLPCPDGTLVLRYEHRLAFRGPAPC